jgi:hypothetical protein
MKTDTWTTVWGIVAAVGQAAQLAPLGPFSWVAQLVSALGLLMLGKQAAGVK